MSTVVRHQSERARYEIEVDGTLAGFAEYAAGDGRMTFTHTEVSPRYQGRGLAAELVRFALDDARQQGASVVPLCWYVRKVIAEHRDRYLDLVPDAERPQFDL